MKIFIEKLYNRFGELIRIEIIIENANGEFALLKTFDQYDDPAEVDEYVNPIAKIVDCEVVECKAVVKK